MRVRGSDGCVGDLSHHSTPSCSVCHGSTLPTPHSLLSEERTSLSFCSPMWLSFSLGVLYYFFFNCMVHSVFCFNMQVEH